MPQRVRGFFVSNHQLKGKLCPRKLVGYPAFISFVRNGDDIPHDVERALELLGLDKTTWRSVDGKS